MLNANACTVFRLYFPLLYYFKQINLTLTFEIFESTKALWGNAWKKIEKLSSRLSSFRNTSNARARQVTEFKIVLGGRKSFSGTVKLKVKENRFTGQAVH